MLELTLIRHAKSSWDDTIPTDYKRPLNQRGRDNAPLIGRVLKQQGKQFDLMLSSPAIRAATTTELLAHELNYPIEKISFNDAFYNAELSTLLETLQALPNSSPRIAIVAHNPGLTELCNHLCAAGIGNLPTCSAVTISFALDDWSAVCQDSGSLVSYEYPRKHLDQD